MKKRVWFWGAFITRLAARMFATGLALAVLLFMWGFGLATAESAKYESSAGVLIRPYSNVESTQIYAMSGGAFLLQADGEEPPLPGTDRHLKFEHISIEQGLSHGTITAILQDSLGFMWFGTEEGLNKFDGYSFTTYKHDPENAYSLSNDEILAIFEDRSGTLWIGTLGGGLSQFNRDTEQFIHYQHDPQDPKSLGDEANEVWSIYEDRSGTLWIGTGTGLEKFDRSTGEFTQYRTVITNPYGREANPVFDIYEGDDGKIWIGTWSGLHSWDRESVRFKHYWPDPGAENEGHNVVQAMAPDGKGYLWLGTGGSGFYRFDLESKRFTQYLLDPADIAGYAYNDVKTIHMDASGDLWLGTDGGGLYHFDPTTEHLSRYESDPNISQSLSSNNVSQIYQDRTGVFWIGTWAGGINKLDHTSDQFVHFQHDPNNPDSLIHNRVLTLFEDQYYDLWIGTDGGGLDRYDRETGRFTHFQHDPGDPASLSGNYIASVYEDSQGDLWVATWGTGLNKLDRETGEFEHYRHDPNDPYSLSSDFILSLLEDNKGDFWVGTSGSGLNLFDLDGGKTVHYRHNPLDRSSLSHNTVTTIYEDSDGILWIGTVVGLDRYDREREGFTHYQFDTDDPSYGISAIHEDHNGWLWVATSGKGLVKFDKVTEHFDQYGEEDGLADDVVYSILEDDQGYLWLGTDYGLSKFDPDAEIFRNYGVSDGLQGYEFTYGAACKSRTGEMFFGGVNGFNAFYPSTIQENLNVPPVVVTSLTQGTQAIDVEAALEHIETITLTWPNNYFEFEFAALNYNQSDRNQYAYMLEGFEEDWNYIGKRRFGRYTNLPGGVYTLRLKGSNNDGIWNEEGTSIRVEVIPPVWQTNWFRAGVLLTMMLAIVAGYRLRIRSIHARSQELEEQVKERTKEIEQQRQELEALFRADEELYSHLQLDEVLQSLVDIAVEILKADKSAVLVWDENRERLYARIARGFSPSSLSVLTFEPGEGITGYVASSGEPVILENAADNLWLQKERADAVQAVLNEGILSLMHLPIKIETEVFGVFNVSYTERHAFGDDEQRLFMALAQRAAQAIENAQRFKEEQRRAEQFKAISEAGSRITSILAINELLDQIVHMVQETLGYYQVGIGLVEGDEIVFKTGAGTYWEKPWLEPRRLKIGVDGVTGWVAKTGQPLLVPDVTVEPRYVPLPGDHSTTAELAVPLKTKDEVIGVLDVESDRSGTLDESDIVVLQSLANQVAAAIENARLYVKAQQVAVLEERSRLARDLHDAVTQTLFSASLLAEVLPETWEADQEEGRQLLQELRLLNRGALAEMRTLLLELRPAVLIEADLADLLRQLAEAVTGRSGLPVAVTIHGRCNLPDEVHVALYRIAQEALNNAVKHAHASQVMVTLRCTASSNGSKAEQQRIELMVCDDGRGFDAGDIPPDHLGLGIIRERAQSIEALLTIESEPHKGTRITVIWEG